MSIRICALPFLFFILQGILFGSCSTKSKKYLGREDSTLRQAVYVNPVYEPVLADPTVVRDPGTGDFFAFGTADDFGDGKGQRMIPVLRSADLVHWQYLKDALTKKPTWKSKGGIWAPDVNFVNGKFYLYYAYSTWGDPDPGIGLAIADSLTGDFADQGKVFLSSEVDVPNSIDPCYFEEDDKKYLFWGSFSDLPTQGTYAVELTADGRKVKSLTDKTKIAAGDWEAVMIHKKGDYYYFFGSKGSCCEGHDSQYHVLVARAKTLLGPYLDQEGRDIAERGNGTVLLKGNGYFVGVGHNAQIITDDAGADWILYHGFDTRHDGQLPHGTNRRALLLDRLEWKDAWPTVMGQGASSTEQPAPTIRQK
ncbi:family 43 glycosylhydrolase [Olivibacter sitiensis]|uniref:family 43 glycosylhydrolase n=1 Tax=Olivibacter sitiensis TaxID=376470 RepID=UPI001FE04B9D|nr:family 43 glycosylhydrolase [Olivibacter sitiensis]